MAHCIIVGCDQHKKSLSLCAAMDKENPKMWTVDNTPQGRQELIEQLYEMAALKIPDEQDPRIVLVYEASCFGFGLWDLLDYAGIECHVLAPSKIPASVQQRKNKTDAKDARRLFQLVRGYVLAGNDLPDVWIPSPELRDDREIARANLDVRHKCTLVKTQMTALLRRNGVEDSGAPDVTKWTKLYVAWLAGLAIGSGQVLDAGAEMALGTLLNQLSALQEELKALEKALKELSKTKRYREAVKELLKIPGVGLLTAMVFLTEMGDMGRFANRREVGAYLGLTPSANESGESSDRKGHITKHGSPRVRGVLCQAAWTWVRLDPARTEFCRRIIARNPNCKKKALVAAMRRLGILMWHRAKAATSSLASPEPHPQASSHSAPHTSPQAA